MTTHSTPADPSPYPPTTLAPQGIMTASDVRDATILCDIVNELRTIEVDFSVRDALSHRPRTSADQGVSGDPLDPSYHLALIFDSHTSFMAFRAKVTQSFHLYDLAYRAKQREDRIATTALLLNIPHDKVRAAMNTQHPNICDECGGTGPSNVPRLPNAYRSSNDPDTEPVSIRTISPITHEPHFYHPSCAAEYSWIVGEVLEGIVPSTP